MNEEIKRVFFGIEIHAPWPQNLPEGRMLDCSHRHMTLGFVGNVSYPPLRNILENIPKPGFQVGISGYFDACLLLPPNHPNVVAWNATAFENGCSLTTYQNILIEWLVNHKYKMDERKWIPHVTLCRQPFISNAWKKAFKPLPFYASTIHLYESTGNLHYIPLWSYPILPPFDEIEHTADMAFIIRGENLQKIYINAFAALAFKFPPFLNYYEHIPNLSSIDDIIVALNNVVCLADGDLGCPLKAISYHGEINRNDPILEWEMIVDV